MRKKLLLPILIATLVFSGMCVCASQPQPELVTISQDNTFTVSYTNDNIKENGFYSVYVLRAGESEVTKSNLLFMRQCKSDSDKTITISDFQLKGDEKCGDLYINGTNVAVLINHSCAAPDFVKIEAVAPSCSDGGNIEYYKCKGCNTLYSDKYAETGITDTVVPAINHQNSAPFHGESNRCDTLRDTDCTYCPDCEKYFEDNACINEIVVTANHAPVKNDRNEPTCAQEGNYEYYECSVCSKKFKEEACSNEFTDGAEMIPAQHTLSEVAATAPTCTEDGILNHWHCNGECGKNYTDDTAQTIMVSTVDGATGHSWSTAVNGREICSVCSEKKPVEIASGVGSGGGGGGAAEKETFTVSFVTNCDISVAALKIKDCKAIDKAAIPQITKEGYKFTGWYTDKELTKAYDFSKAVNKGFTLYAKWEEAEQSAENENFTEMQSKSYTDIEESAWYYDAVLYAKENGLMNGVEDGRFAPDDNITRAMLVTILYRLENEPEVKAATFDDVEKGSWYCSAVAWASENSITSGVNEKEFAPDSSISREQIATMLYRYARLKGYDISAVENASLVTFADSEDVSQYAISAFKWAVSEDIMNGKTQTALSPRDNATRAETAALLMRVVEKYSK